jgi:predicted NAD/FAD-dependent oxidoreductase
MAGLGAARALTAAGHQVVIYEKSQSIGGRMATRRIEGCIVDHGAQNLKPGGSELADVMLHQLPTEDLIRIEMPVCLYRNDGQILPSDPEREAEPKFAYRNGLTTLPKLLAQQLPAERTTFHHETRIYRLSETEDGVTLYDEHHTEVGRADAVIVTAPAPQAADLLDHSALYLRSSAEALDRIRALRNVEYGACLSVLLGYSPPIPAPPAYALLAEDRANPLLWLAFEQVKALERAPNGEAVLVAQLGPFFSRMCYLEEDPLVIGRALNELKLLFGMQYDQPTWAQVKRWKYSQPNGMVYFFEVNWPEMSSSVIISGDALRPENGRVHQAYASGLEAAAFVLPRLA